MNDPLEFLLILFFSFLFFVIIPLSLIKHFIVKPFVEAMDRKTEMFRGCVITHNSHIELLETVLFG